MKKLLSTACMAILLLFGFSAYSKSSIIWTLKDKPEKGYFKTHKTINSNFSGFLSKEESDKFISKIKSNSDVASVSTSNADAKGNCDVVLTMKETHERMYYARFAEKMEIAYIQVNGKKRTPAEIAQGTKN